MAIWIAKWRYYIYRYIATKITTGEGGGEFGWGGDECVYVPAHPLPYWPTVNPTRLVLPVCLTTPQAPRPALLTPTRELHTGLSPDKFSLCSPRTGHPGQPVPAKPELRPDKSGPAQTGPALPARSPTEAQWPKPAPAEHPTVGHRRRHPGPFSQHPPYSPIPTHSHTGTTHRRPHPPPPHGDTVAPTHGETRWHPHTVKHGGTNDTPPLTRWHPPRRCPSWCRWAAARSCSLGATGRAGGHEGGVGPYGDGLGKCHL